MRWDTFSIYEIYTMTLIVKYTLTISESIFKGDVFWIADTNSWRANG